MSKRKLRKYVKKICIKYGVSRDTYLKWKKGK